MASKNPYVFHHPKPASVMKHKETAKIKNSVFQLSVKIVILQFVIKVL